MHRFYLNQSLMADQVIDLPHDIAHHIGKVLRMRAGDTVVLWNGDGHEWPARLMQNGPAWQALLSAPLPPQAIDPVAITLIQGLPEGDKMDWIVEKTCEAGVAQIWPVQARRSVVKLQGERLAKRQLHWARVAIAACNQCGRARLPELGTIQPAGDAFAQAAARQPDALLWLLSPEGAQRATDAFRAAFCQPATIEHPRLELVIAIGPEGGWDNEEKAAALASGFTPVTLGNRVLRTETAGLYACAQAQAWAGVMGDR